VKNNIFALPTLTHMKIRMFVILALLATAVIIAGCTQVPGPTSPVPTPTPEQTIAVPQTTSTPAPQPSFTLGDHYLKKSYAFQSVKDVYIEDVRVDNASWGIGFDVLPLTDNVTESWFVMKVTNRDSGQTDLYGYGSAYDFEPHHLIPRYTTGPFEIEMKGYLVKVDVMLAKRNP
jgi:hypothetical protein